MERHNSEENEFDLNEPSNYTATGSDFVSGHYTARSSLQRQNLRHAPTALFSQSTQIPGASRTVSDFVTSVTNTGLIPLERHPRSSFQMQNLRNAPTATFPQSTQFPGASRTVSDFVSSVTNTGLIPLERHPRSSFQTQNLQNSPTATFSQSTQFPGASRTVSDFVTSVTNTGLIPLERHPRSSFQMQNLRNAPTATFSQSTQFPGASRTVSDFVSSVTNTGLIPLEGHPISSFQTQNLWNAPTASFTPSTHVHGDSSLALLENSTHLSFIEQHTEFHGGSSSASRNQSNAFIQPSVTHMMMRDLPESSSRYQSNVAIHPSSGPVGYLPGRDANFLRNNIDPTLLPLVIGESTVAVYNRERIQSVGGSAREPGHRDNPIVIEQNGSIATESLKSPDDEEDDHDYAQHNGIFYEGDMSYEALLSLQEHIGGVGTGLKKNVISELLKQSKYQSTKMKNCSDSCCICLGTYDDNEELGKIDCGHEFHYQCIRKWLKIKNSCPICRRIALNP